MAIRSIFGDPLNKQQTSENTNTQERENNSNEEYADMNIETKIYDNLQKIIENKLNEFVLKIEDIVDRMLVKVSNYLEDKISTTTNKDIYLWLIPSVMPESCPKLTIY